LESEPLTQRESHMRDTVKNYSDSTEGNMGRVGENTWVSIVDVTLTTNNKRVGKTIYRIQEELAEFSRARKEQRASFAAKK
jgi:predicted Co/Zn/Cd cation transporter (cation efflux family)